ncbi:hypothetical protein NECAME_07627 [Necator americanus]|uniref:Uncharacterized protein n=1 Tax=Necator americanus TaxID=51031 RepID=W2TMH7_NECAM|nr:hypothetical protein NECAME_07627 [Necator americanus]ETN82973.1 hypothetical protein NECAME_07627 [Necator americanus]
MLLEEEHSGVNIPSGSKREKPWFLQDMLENNGISLNGYTIIALQKEFQHPIRKIWKKTAGRSEATVFT